MSKKLSVVMARALREIARTGGRAVPKLGGWWYDSAGDKLLTVASDIYTSGRAPVRTNTVFALARRGLLERSGYDAFAGYHAYRLTQAGRAEAEKLK